MITVFYFFAGLIIAQGVLSLRGGFRYLKYVRERLSEKDDSSFAPFVTVFAPCRGVDEGLKENLQALFNQDYPRYEILFIVDDERDAARSVIDEVRALNNIKSRVLISGKANGCSQKIHNMIYASERVDDESRVFAFCDSDARPAKNWLGALVRELKDEQVGAATGYRWFVPSGEAGLSARFLSHLRAVWNASTATVLGANAKDNFCWGGATAMRRATFEDLNIREVWRAAVSSDWTLTNKIKESGLEVRFVPQALTPSFGRDGWRELWSFTTRQIQVTRVYAPRVWQLVLWSNTVFALVFFGGWLVVLKRLLGGESFVVPLMILTVIFTLGAAKAMIRLRAVSEAWSAHKDLQTELARPSTVIAHATLWTLTPILFALNAIAAWRTRRIAWRGIVYEFKPGGEVVVVEINAPVETKSQAAYAAKEP